MGTLTIRGSAARLTGTAIVITSRPPVRFELENPSPPPPGGGGSTPGGTYVQSTPDLVWTVNHNLGRDTQVTILTLGGVEILASITHTSQNQFIVAFNTPQAGKAIYS